MQVAELPDVPLFPVVFVVAAPPVVLPDIPLVVDPVPVAAPVAGAPVVPLPAAPAAPAAGPAAYDAVDRESTNASALYFRTPFIVISSDSLLVPTWRRNGSHLRLVPAYLVAKKGRIGCYVI
jgi:hypothetical protein